MSVTKCPSCGSVLFLTAEPGGNWKRDQRFDATANPFGDAQLAGSWSKTIPHSKIEPRDVLTSLMDAGVTALFCGVAGGGLAAFTHADPIGWAGVGAFCGAAFRYFDGMGLARTLTQAIEEWTSAEPEPQPTKPAPVAHVIRAETVDQQGNWRFASIDVPAHVLSQFANDIELSQKTFSERTATGAGMTQAQFSTLRDQFVENGWARWNHPDRKQNGVSLTKKGEAIIRAIATEPIPPSPIDI